MNVVMISKLKSHTIGRQEKKLSNENFRIFYSLKLQISNQKFDFT